MPLPEGMSRTGVRRRVGRAPHPLIAAWPTRGAIRHARHSGLPIYAEADFCIAGTVDPHAADCPKGRSATTWATTAWPTTSRSCRCEHVYHRPDAIWPFTVVGRPPQEDTIFGQLIHELTGPVIPTVDSRACTRCMPSTRRACIRCCWPSAANATCRTSRTVAGRRNCSRRPTRSWARASCRWPSTC